PERTPLRATAAPPAAAVPQHTELLTIPSLDQSAQDELMRTAPNLALLTHLTDATGGVLNPPASAILDRKPGTERAVYPLARVFLPLAMLLFLGDTAVRKLSRPGMWQRPPGHQGHQEAVG